MTTPTPLPYTLAAFAETRLKHCTLNDIVQAYGKAEYERGLLDAMNATRAFIKHEVEQSGDWSDWVCPDPKSYLIKCCDCGLVHEAQFGVVQYAVGNNEDCEPVVAQNVQAVFRMRRSEQWTPEDTAHRPGGLSQEAT